MWCTDDAPSKHHFKKIMRHQRNHYRVYTSSGIKYLEQVSVDFRKAPCL